MKQPYRITQATLTTYSGRKVVADIESEIFTEPIKKVKDKILDGFIKACSKSTDPFVKIECKVKYLFS